MKFIIRENKIIGIMDSILKLSYNPETREFYSGGAIDRVIGYKHKGGFTYAGYHVDDMVSNLFGNNADEWLLIYLKEKFPHLKINKINN
jgi:hypothetical protein